MPSGKNPVSKAGLNAAKKRVVGQGIGKSAATQDKAARAVKDAQRARNRAQQIRNAADQKARQQRTAISKRSNLPGTSSVLGKPTKKGESSAAFLARRKQVEGAKVAAKASGGGSGGGGGGGGHGHHHGYKRDRAGRFAGSA